MTTRRDFLKKTTSLVVALPMMGLATTAFAGEVSGETSLKGLGAKDIQKRGRLEDWLANWIKDRIKRSKNPEEAFKYLKEVQKELDHEINKAAKTVRGVLEDGGEEKLRGIKFKLSFSFPPPNIKLEVTF